MKYLVSTEWRGRLHIGTMRLYDSMEEVCNYLKTELSHDLDCGFYRVYKFDEDRKARLVTRTEINKYLG